MAWLMKEEEYYSIHNLWLHIKKSEYMPRKIKLSAQINHFIYPDFSTCKGSGLYRNKFYSPNYNLLKSPQQYILQHMMLIPVTCSKPLPSYVSRIHHSISKHNFFRYRPKVYISQYRLGLVFDGFSSFSDNRNELGMTSITQN